MDLKPAHTITDKATVAKPKGTKRYRYTRTLTIFKQDKNFNTIGRTDFEGHFIIGTSPLVVQEIDENTMLKVIE